MDTTEKIPLEAAENESESAIETVETKQERQRQDFTSEIYKIELKNLSRFGFGELKKFLKKKHHLQPVKIKALPDRDSRNSHAFICFRSEEERKSALTKLDGSVWKGKTIKAVYANAVQDPMQKLREFGDSNAKKGSTTKLSGGGQKKTILEATAPLASIDYEQQLAIKEADSIKVLTKYYDELKRVNRSLIQEMKINRKIGEDGLPWKWQGFKPSPKTMGYRNKSEFTIGKNANGDKVVGFRLGSYADGTIEVAEVCDLPHIPDNMKLAAKLFQSFIRQSNYDVFSPELYTGEFRQLTVRVSMATNEIMLIICLHTKNMKDVALTKLTEDIVQYFTDGDGKELNVSSIFMEKLNKREIGQTTNLIDHVYGVKYITEIIHGLKFRISPLAFFQTNTAAAEVLYQNAIDLGGPTMDTTVLDICCGTGTIGLCFAGKCKRVIGVEIIADAILDAKHNANENGINNCEFFAGNCDDYIASLMHKHKESGGTDVLAIFDPPRVGLHTRSIAAIRSARNLKRFIYIACNPNSAMRNWIDLGRPASKAYKGNPFIPTAAVGVDMFPHTQHKEMILLFERVADDGEDDKNVDKKTEEGKGTMNVVMATVVDSGDDKKEKVASIEEKMIVEENYNK